MSKSSEKSEHSEKCPHAPHGDEGKKDFQKKYMQFQIARQYLVALSEEKAALEQKLIELTTTIASLHGLKDTKKSEEIWSTLGSDVFVMSDIKNIETAIVGVGAGIYVRKPIDAAAQTLNARHAELMEVNKQLTNEINILNQQLAKLEPEIQAMAAQMQGENE